MMASLALCLALATLGFASADSQVYYSIVSKSTWFGPDTSGSAGTTFSDLNYLLNKGPINQIAFDSATNGSAGLALWYSGTKILHGMGVSNNLATNIDTGITKITAQWTTASLGRAARFVSFTFTQSNGMAITLGTPSATAQSATYTAPFNSFLGAFEGRAGNGTIQELRILWVRTTVAVAPYKTGATNYIVAGPKADATAFDSTSVALKNGRITKIQGFLNSSASGLLVTYGNLVQRYGDWRDVPSTGALDISATITRVEGGYTQNAAGTGRFLYITFRSTNGQNWTVGSVPTSTLTFKTFDAIAPTNSYLGAFRGYQTASAIRQLSLVWFSTVK